MLSRPRWLWTAHKSLLRNPFKRHPNNSWIFNSISVVIAYHMPLSFYQDIISGCSKLIPSHRWLAVEKICSSSRQLSCSSGCEMAPLKIHAFKRKLSLPFFRLMRKSIDHSNKRSSTARHINSTFHVSKTWIVRLCC